MLLKMKHCASSDNKGSAYLQLSNSGLICNGTKENTYKETEGHVMEAQRKLSWMLYSKKNKYLNLSTHSIIYLTLVDYTDKTRYMVSLIVPSGTFSVPTGILQHFWVVPLWRVIILVCHALARRLQVLGPEWVLTLTIIQSTYYAKAQNKELRQIRPQNQADKRGQMRRHMWKEEQLWCCKATSKQRPWAREKRHSFHREKGHAHPSFQRMVWLLRMSYLIAKPWSLLKYASISLEFPVTAQKSGNQRKQNGCPTLKS